MSEEILPTYREKQLEGGWMGVDLLERCSENVEEIINNECMNKCTKSCTCRMWGYDKNLNEKFRLLAEKKSGEKGVEFEIPGLEKVD